jgi:hypothetical protein
MDILIGVRRKLGMQEASVMDGDLDRAAVAFLRKLKPEIQQEFLDSEEFRSLSGADRERLYEIDAELSEAER